MSISRMPGSMLMVMLRVSISVTRFIRSVDSMTPPHLATQPPHRPVPAPRGVSGMSCSWQ